MSKVKNCLTDGQITKLASKTVGRTGYDIDAIVRKAKRIPKTKLRRSAGFVNKPTPLLCLDQRCKKLHMTTEVLKAGQKPVYDDRQFKSYCVPALTYDDVLSAIAKHPKTVHDDHLKKHVEYGKSIDMNIDEPSLN